MTEWTPAYLLPREAAELLGVSMRTIRRRCELWELPSLTISSRLHRVETSALVPNAPEILPPGPAVVTVTWLTHLLRIDPQSLSILVQQGVVPMWRQGCQRDDLGRFAVPASLVMHRKELWSWIMLNSCGYDFPAPALTIDQDALGRLRETWRTQKAWVSVELADE